MKNDHPDQAMEPIRIKLTRVIVRSVCDCERLVEWKNSTMRMSEILDQPCFLCSKLESHVAVISFLLFNKI